MMRGRLFWAILGVIAGAYYIRASSAGNRRTSGPLIFLNRQGQRARGGRNGASPLEVAAQAGRAAWESARKVVMR